MTIKEQILGIMDVLNTINCQVDNYDILATAIALWLRADITDVEYMAENELKKLVEKVTDFDMLMTDQSRETVDEFLVEVAE